MNKRKKISRRSIFALTCPSCNWKGSYGEATLYADKCLIEVYCPKCHRDEPIYQTSGLIKDKED